MSARREKYCPLPASPASGRGVAAKRFEQDPNEATPLPLAGEAGRGPGTLKKREGAIDANKNHTSEFSAL
jgi:hypothetical protein